MSGENEEDKVLLHQETAKTSYAAAYAELFPDMMPVPEEVGVSCCAQFGVTREAVRRRPRKDYIRYRDWLVQTELSDDTSGRVFEYSWHSKHCVPHILCTEKPLTLDRTVIFGKDPVYCPSAEDCYCKLYGFCDLECEDEGTCSSRYVLPKYSSMPKGWPLIGFNKMPRKFSGPL